MKKLSLVLLALTAFLAPVFAAQLGAGYSNGGLTLRSNWNGSVISELSITGDYTSDTSLPYEYLSVRYYIAPLIITVNKTTFADINLGIKFMQNISYTRDASTSGRIETADYTLFLMLPEVEFKIPFNDNMKITASAGISARWKVDARGSYSPFEWGFWDIKLANFGFIYYM